MASTKRKRTGSGLDDGIPIQSKQRCTCPHLEAFLLNANGLSDILGIFKYIRVAASSAGGPPTPSSPKSTSMSKGSQSDSANIPNAACSICKKTSPLHLYACTSCVFIGCRPSPLQSVGGGGGTKAAANHLGDHSRATGHSLSVDLGFSQLYCTQCQDYVYSSVVLEAVVKLNNGETATRGRYVSSITARHLLVQEESSKLLLEQFSTPHFGIDGMAGLRGLHNMGNTCFMSVILQSLLHNPPLRNFFLSDMHSSYDCTVWRRNQAMQQQQQPQQQQQLQQLQQQQQQQQLLLLLQQQHHQHGDSGGYGGPGAAGSADLDIGTALNAGGVGAVGSYNSLNGSGGADPTWTCIGCGMDALFLHMFSGQVSAFPPSRLLYSVWKSNLHLAGYAQQDAHEFLISLLDSIHTACGGGLSATKQCSCIVHSVFGGKMKSDVTCLECNNVSSTVDPTLDVPVDVARAAAAQAASRALVGGGGAMEGAPPDNRLSEGTLVADGASADVSAAVVLAAAASSILSVNAVTLPSAPTAVVTARVGTGAGAASSVPGPSVAATLNPYWVAMQTAMQKKRELDLCRLSLTECLETYTSPEHLTDENKFFCGKCKSHTDSLKQMVFQSLPVVLCFQIKRFHRQNAKKNTALNFKLDTKIDFPLDGLNMASYINPSSSSSSSSSLSFSSSSSSSPPSSSSLSPPILYDLFSVVVHLGTLDAGHYICYIRRKNLWYKCDDQTVTPASEMEVAAAQPYVLHYIRRHVPPQALMST